ncbi:MAG: serine protease [Alphaproteobacteria bacterium]|nr:serine protease [Alphaproteobacteria bacterium]
MRGLLINAYILAAWIAISIAPAVAVEPPTIAKRLEASAVRVFTVGKDGRTSGTGFVVNREGHVATAYHIVKQHIQNKWKIFVAERGRSYEHRRPATLVKAYRGEDLAILKVEGLTQQPVRLNDRDSGRPVKGTTIFAIGFPEAGRRLDGDFDTTFTIGTVSRVFVGSWEEKGPRIRIIQHTAPTNPGSSGGPIVNACGQVVGINTQRAVAIILLPGGIPIVTDFIQGVSFASHVEVLISKLKDLRVNYSGIRGTCRTVLGVSSTNFLLYGVIAALLAVALPIIGAFLLFRTRRPPVVQIIVHCGHAMKNGAKAVGRLVRRKR